MAESPKVMVGVVHSRTGWEPETIASLLSLVMFDAYHQRRIPIPSETNPEGGVLFCSGTNIAGQRNKIVRDFLKSDCDWLLFVDTDEKFPPTLVEQFLASVDEDERPIVSGLVMARRDETKPISPACVVLDKEWRYTTPGVVPMVRFWNVAAVGSGALMVHRKVYEAIAEKYAHLEPMIWYQHELWSYVDDDGETIREEMGEDYVFSRRAQDCGFPTIVDTTIELGHVKAVELTADTFYRQNASLGYLPTYVVVPVKDRLDLTQGLIEQLREQGGWDGILVYDNGSKKPTREWLAAQSDLRVFAAPDAGIHEMWNAGIHECLHRSGGRCNIAFLNNDLVLGDRFLQGLTQGLRAGPWMAVGPNYDGRYLNVDFDAPQVEQVRGICAERYDGTGGLPGFAFMVRGEFFAAGYRFPTDCKWWYGDNDLTMTLDMQNMPYGIVGDVAVEHLGAGTAKDWSDPKWQKQLQADKEAWLARWAALGVDINFGDAA